MLYRNAWPVFLFIAVFGFSCKSEREVVVYTAHDRIYSEPILKEIQRSTRLSPKPKYDSEATKTIGLVNALRAEKNKPRCDVWWNNEILNTIRLKKEGLLEPVQLKAKMPDNFRDPEGYWYGFAARARILIVNTELVPEEKIPSSILDLTKAEWKGKCGIAKPLFGTTATHVAVLFATMGEEPATQFLQALKDNDIKIESGNRGVAQKVANGQLAIGLTDTDDAFVELQNGSPVRIVFPDQKDYEFGTLLIPNTVAKIKGGPNSAAADKLMQAMLQPGVEVALAKSKAAQIPLNRSVHVRPPLGDLSLLKFMEVDFEKAADMFERSQKVVETQFLK